MKRLFSVFFMALILCYCPAVYAEEHGGKEHGGKEHGGKEHGGKEHGGKIMAEPTAKEIKKAMADYVETKSKKTGTFEIMDSVTKSKRQLKLQRIHERVGKTGDYYYSCADFVDTISGELLDLDIDVENKDGNLNVVDVRIHKVKGKERYTYDKNDNRIPVK
jgi:hypothetical protein